MQRQEAKRRTAAVADRYTALFLLNLLSGERWELVASYRRLKDAVEVMLENKYGAKASFSDSAFTAECRCTQAQPPPHRTMPVECTVGAPSLDCVAP